MADLTSITAVRPTADTQISRVKYGATISEGDSLYLDTADSEHKLTDSTAQATAVIAGIAMTPGVDGGYGVMATSGSIILVGTTMAIGQSYAVSTNAAKIAPETDIATTEYVSRIGTAASATQLDLKLDITGIQHA
jgi:hypothetical protein